METLKINIQAIQDVIDFILILSAGALCDLLHSLPYHEELCLYFSLHTRFYNTLLIIIICAIMLCIVIK